MRHSEILMAIQKHIGLTPPYTEWTVGLTSDLTETRSAIRENGPRYPEPTWGDWPADSLSEAQRLVAKCKELGMSLYNGNEIDGNRPIYVFVY